MVGREKRVILRPVLTNKTENKRKLRLILSVEVLKNEVGDFFRHFKNRESIKILMDLIKSIINGAKRIEKMLKTVEKEENNAKKTKSKD